MKQRMNVFWQILPPLVLVIGAVMAVITALGAGKDMQKLQGRLGSLEQLREMAAQVDAAGAPQEFLQSRARPEPPPLRDLADVYLQSENAVIRSLPGVDLGQGYRLERLEIRVEPVDISRAMTFIESISSARNPWQVMELELLPGPDGPRMILKVEGLYSGRDA